MPLMEIEAAITDRGQTTIPTAIRRILQVGKRSTVVFRVNDDGSVTLSAKQPDVDDAPDPVVEAFLGFLADDMIAHPDHLTTVTADWKRNIDALTAGIEIDLDAALPEEDD